MNVPIRMVVFAVLGFFALFGETRARAIPDFYTDKDLEAWHQFGLRSFYGPWTVIARKPNGDLVSYADYGARVPPDFQPLSSETIDNDSDDNDDDNDDSSAEISRSERSQKRSTGLSDFAGPGYQLTPYGISVLNSGSLSPDSTTTGSSQDDNAVTLNTNTDIRQLIQSIDPIPKESKRDTLELIGIVGVISGDDESSDINSTTGSDYLTTVNEESNS